ncbi:MAG: two-component system, OmpR family, sensor kinase [Pseudonocardiales bacterium]|nr:two-component system, OmpR family, sensor kinase [Pseudonocardiales bacterium]
MRAWLHSVRGRLIATYLVAATVLATAGVALLAFTLASGLRANVDAGLQTRADPLAADVASGHPGESGPAPTVGLRRSREGEIGTFTAVFDPSGRLVYAVPGQLPTAPSPAKNRSGSTFVTTRYDGQPFRVLTVPVPRSDGSWLVVTGQSLDAANDATTQVRHTLYVAIPIVLALVGLGAWWLSGAALRPVDRMSADAARLSEHAERGGISEPPTRDSLSRLAHTFNGLLDRLHDSIDRQREFVADAGHELRTPLAVLQTELQTAVRPGRTREDLAESIGHARIEVARLAQLADDLLLLAQVDTARPLARRELTEIRPLIEHVVAAYRSSAEARSQRVGVVCPRDLVADVDPSAVQRILGNVLTNALRHAPAGGSIRVTAAIEVGQLVLRVRDDGPGFAPEFLGHAFERFSRSDSARGRAAVAGGTGLGLAIVESLAVAHDGSAEIANSPGGGATVTVRLRLP